MLTALVLCAFVSCSPERLPVCRARVRVLDGMTDTPVCGACVAVPETGERFCTGADGRTEVMELPVLRDEGYDRLLPSDGGRITFIIYAEEYMPYLLLYARTHEGERGCFDVLLFPDDGTLPVFTVIEAPPSEWAEELVSRYR